MAGYKTSKYRPILRFELSIPFVSIYTAIMNDSLGMAITEYVTLYWKVWKWHGEIRLYDAMRRQAIRS